MLGSTFSIELAKKRHDLQYPGRGDGLVRKDPARTCEPCRRRANGAASKIAPVVLV